MNEGRCFMRNKDKSFWTVNPEKMHRFMQNDTAKLLFHF